MTLRRFVERLIWLSILPLMALGAALIVVQVDTQHARRQMLADTLVRAAAHAVDRDLEVRLASLALLARLLEEEASSPKGQVDLNKALRMMLQYLEQHGHHVLMESASGQMLLNTRIPLGQSLPGPPHFQGHPLVTQALLTQSPAVGDAFRAPIAKTDVVALAAPMARAQDAGMALLSTIELAHIGQRLQAFKVPAKWKLRLIDRQGQELAAAGQDAEDEPPWRGAGAASLHSVRLEQVPWTMVLRTPAVSLMDSAAVQTMVLMLALAVSILTVYWGSRMTTMRLTGAMRSIVEPGTQPPIGQDIEEVAQVREVLRQMALQRDAAQEAERRRIGLELHDDLQQKLALLRYRIEALQPPTADGPTSAGAAKVDIHPTLELVDETIESTRRLVQNLRPPALDEGGLPSALMDLAQQHRRVSGQAVDVQLINEADCKELPPATAAALYRIAQEALNNVRKHAKAQSVHLCLDAGSAHELVLEVTDDGMGMTQDTAMASSGNGLRGIRERVQLLGGTVAILTEPDQGTALVVRVPLGSNALRP